MTHTALKRGPLRILVVEGPGRFAGTLLSTLPGFEVIHTERIMAAAHLFEGFIREGRDCDALLLDLTTSAASLEPAEQGLDAFRLARALFPGLAILTLGSRDRGSSVETLISEGAQACLDKMGLDAKTLSAALEQSVVRNQSEARRYRALFQSAPIGILLAVGRRIIMANPGALAALGHTEKDLKHLSVLDLFPGHSRSLLEKALDNADERGIPEAVFEATFAHNPEKPSFYQVYVKGALVNNAPAVALYLVPSVEKQIVLKGHFPSNASHSARPDQAHHEEKMKALARLAGGAAHDFNNLLTAINGYSEYLLDFTEPDGSLGKGLKAINKAGEAAVDLTRRMLAFSNVEPIVAQPIVIDEAIEGLVIQLEKVLGPDIRLSMKLQAKNYTANWPTEYLEQMIVNLCLNSKEAMPQGGTLTLSSQVLLPEAILPGFYTHLTPTAKPGMVLTVEDTGRGMTEDILHSLCEPFFSTKRGGRGTGLGLASVYGMLKQLQGGLSIKSQPGQGSQFQLFFPAEKPAVAQAPLIEKSPTHPWTPSGSGETILVVDDDSSLREMLVAVLQRFGYRVHEAASAEEALDFIEHSTQGVDLVLTDVMLRGDGGHELGEKIQQIKSGLQTIYISGHSLESLADLGIVIAPAVFLEKPFTPLQLSNKVRTLLDTARFLS